MKTVKLPNADHPITIEPTPARVRALVAGHDDQASMEHPTFSLSKTLDLNIRVNGHSITITPSANGPIVERTSSNRMACIELTLSEWLDNAVVATEVLTLSRDYFRLGKGLERHFMNSLASIVACKQSSLLDSTLCLKNPARCAC